MKRSYKNICFDLDGTLLDTLPDIASAINEALRICGYPYSYSVKEAKALVGNGTDVLVKRALREKEEDKKAFEELKQAYLPLYKSKQNEHTQPFPGILDLLNRLKGSHACFVVTNKPDEFAKIIVETHFPSCFEAVVGNVFGEPVKPNPATLNRLIEQFGLDKKETLFVGDSYVDVETAHNGGLPCCLCTWGYGSYSKELLDRADYVVNNPLSILDLL